MSHLPEKDVGLYEAACEHDSCGIGAVINIDGSRSHRILELGNRILLNLQHRGAAGSDETTGDGAGILIQIPHEFFVSQAERLGIRLGREGDYGVGMLFCPKDPSVGGIPTANGARREAFGRGSSTGPGIGGTKTASATSRVNTPTGK